MTTVLFNLMEQEWFLNIVATVATAVGLGLATLITYGFSRLNAWIATKTKNENLARTIDLAEKLVSSSVAAVQQTFVEQLKKDGKFDKEAQELAMRKALMLVISQLTPEAKTILEESFGDLQVWLATQIEALVYSTLPHSGS